MWIILSDQKYVKEACDNNEIIMFGKIHNDPSCFNHVQTVCFSGELFMMFEPFITSHSIQYANGADGKSRRTNFDKTFSYDSLDMYYNKLQGVSRLCVYL